MAKGVNKTLMTILIIVLVALVSTFVAFAFFGLAKEETIVSINSLWDLFA